MYYRTLVVVVVVVVVVVGLFTLPFRFIVPFPLAALVRGLVVPRRNLGGALRRSRKKRRCCLAGGGGGGRTGCYAWLPCCAHTCVLCMLLGAPRHDELTHASHSATRPRPRTHHAMP
eukprot:scaffold5493_cov125-Isochrysis_galbana.AAC.1